MGYTSDKIEPWFLGVTTLALTSLSTFVLWGIVSHSLDGILVFAVAYGILAGGWTTLWTGLSKPVASKFLFPSAPLYDLMIISFQRMIQPL
jgi:MFS transporter, MCT family, solute carrier family 16 (monocarboxylic acid transporters), member 10